MAVSQLKLISSPSPSPSRRIQLHLEFQFSKPSLLAQRLFSINCNFFAKSEEKMIFSLGRCNFGLRGWISGVLGRRRRSRTSPLFSLFPPLPKFCFSFRFSRKDLCRKVQHAASNLHFRSPEIAALPANKRNSSVAFPAREKENAPENRETRRGPRFRNLRCTAPLSRTDIMHDLLA